MRRRLINTLHLSHHPPAIQIADADCLYMVCCRGNPPVVAPTSPQMVR